MTGVPAETLTDASLERELAHLHATRHDTFLHGSQDALHAHTVRTAELEGEYLRRNPDRVLDARRTRHGSRELSGQDAPGLDGDEPEADDGDGPEAQGERQPRR